MAALIVLVAVLAVYTQSLGGPFLWDDQLLILGSPLVEQGGSLGDFLNTPFWSGAGVHGTSTSYYRPLVTLSFALDNAVHGANSGGFHLTNVVLHATNALLLYSLLRKHEVRAASAALVAVAWALLPRLAEAAAWISGRTDLLVALFTLGALLAWGRSTTRRLLAAALVGLAFLAKESAVGGVVALAAFAWVESATLPWQKRIVRALAALAPTLFAMVAYVVLRLLAVGLPGETEDLGTLGRLATIFEASGTYAAMLVDAFRPRAVIGRSGVTSASGIAAGVAAVLLTLALVRLRARVDARRAMGVALFFGALLPVLHVVPIPLRTLAADRFLYLPTAGLALALAPSIDRFVGVARARWAAALVLTASLSIVTFQRVGVFSDEIEFWVRTYRETPITNNAAAIELAGVYSRAALYEDALLLSERALRYDDPRRATAYYNAALCRTRLGRHDDVTRAKLVALRGKRQTASDVELLLALLEIRAGRFDAARAVLEPLATSGKLATARVLFERLGELELAHRELHRLGPSSPPERRAALGTLLDDEPIAKRAFQEILEKPDVSRALATKALLFFVERGDGPALAGAASAFRARFGTIDAGLVRMIDVRLAELARLIAARARVGLSGRERTREIALPDL
jgi:tetratricopeptide (TPR) repeat protein